MSTTPPPGPPKPGQPPVEKPQPAIRHVSHTPQVDDLGGGKHVDV